MRRVFDTLDDLGIRYLITGSVAASVHGVLRQSQDTDVALDLEAARFGVLADALGSGFAIADPIDVGEFSMASVIDRTNAEMVALILRRPGPFESISSVGRRGSVRPIGCASSADAT